MTDKTDTIPSYIYLNGHYYQRIVYDGTSGKRCPECGVNIKKTHRRGCDREECPRCHGKINNCNCEC